MESTNNPADTDPYVGVALDFVTEHGIDIAVIVLGAFLARYFGDLVIIRLVRQAIRHTKFNRISRDDALKRQNTLISMFTAVWHVVVVVIASILLFAEMFPGVNLFPFFASAGIIGLAIGFGAQSLVKDFLSGIFIILENQYRVGDVVELQTAVGTVEKISIRTTVVRDNDGNVHYIPNGTITHVVNKTMGYSRVNLNIKVAVETDVDKLADVINDVGDDMAKSEKWKDKILEPPKFLSISNFTDTALEVKISGQTQPSEQWAVSDELRKRLFRALSKEKIKLK
jgi:small conductance mechanosensitive channel